MNDTLLQSHTIRNKETFRVIRLCIFPATLCFFHALDYDNALLIIVKFEFDSG